MFPRSRSPLGEKTAQVVQQQEQPQEQPQPVAPVAVPVAGSESTGVGDGATES